MKTIILFPSDYFDVKRVDETYLPEYNEVCKLPEFTVLLYNHDMFINEEILKFYPHLNDIDGVFCIGRTWMLSPQQYQKLYERLLSHNIKLINAPDEYNRLHLFPLIYPTIKDFTPKILWFDNAGKIDVDSINSEFKRFMIKDYVKSAKEYNFPKCFETPVKQDELKIYVDRFVGLRSSLFTGGFVFKEYVDLKRYDSITNEYRAFYLNSNLLTVSRNSNQPDSCPYVPESFVQQFKKLPSNYYTIDFAELDSGGFIVLETGDGQVSGLSPNQYIFKYYDEMRTLLNDSI